MPLRSTLTALVLAFASTTGTTAEHGPTPPARDARASVDVIGRGTGPRVLLRWRNTSEGPVAIQVSTRTVPSSIESPGLDDDEPEVRLSGFMRPPVEKTWTLQGRLARVADDGSATVEARWRVTDAAARLHGVRPVDRDLAADPAETVKGDGPTEAPLRDRGQPSNEDLVSRKIPEVARRGGSDAAAMARAIEFERITNTSLQRTDGAAITQTIGPRGVLQNATTARLLEPDRRADFEISGLIAILTLSEPTLPSEPLGIGGSWKTTWSTVERTLPVTVEATWTVKAFDEAATTVGAAESAVLGVEFRRTIAADADVRPTTRAAMDVTGRGEVRIRLDQPLGFESRFVSTPIAPAPAGRSVDVTRMRVIQVVNRESSP